MDFLEGFLMGPIWSDTEYETRRHTGLYWLFGWLAFAIYIWLQFTPVLAQPWLALPRWAPLVTFAFLLLLAPFACRYYYQLSLLVKLPILSLLIIKLLAGFLAFYQWLLPLYTLQTEDLPQDLLEYINQTIAKSTETFSSMGQAVGMLVGILVGGLQVVFTFVGILLLASIVPALYLAFLQIIQRLVDYLVHYTLLRDLDI